MSAANLYEELGISKEATVEEVRKAYKKKALLTHPDRLPQGATADDKAASEEKFRRVNNAYEVLSDPTKRKEYDKYGVWPPVEREEAMPSHGFSSRSHHSSFSNGHGPFRSQTFPSPFFSSQFQNTFQFTDPFALFDEIFQDTPFSRSSRRFDNRSQFGSFNHFDRMQAEIDEFMNDLDRDPFMPSMSSRGFMNPMRPVSVTTSSTSFGGGSGGSRFISESYSSTTINGVQQSVHKRVDAEGNEHVTRTYPDGTQVRTINGVEQPSRGQIASSGHGLGRNPSRRHTEHSGSRYIQHSSTAPPQPTRSPITISTSSSSSSRNAYIPQSHMETAPYTQEPSPISPRGYESSGPTDVNSDPHHHHHHLHSFFPAHLHRHRTHSSSSSNRDKYNYSTPTQIYTTTANSYAPSPSRYSPNPTDVPDQKQRHHWWHRR